MKKLQILGTGCPKCKTLAEQAEKVARELGIAYEMEKVTDIREIMKFGVLSTQLLPWTAWSRRPGISRRRTRSRSF